MKISLLIETKGLTVFGDVRAEYGADLMTVRVNVPSLGQEVPVIPGTQVKGSLRTVATMIHDILASKNIISWNTGYFKTCLGSLKSPCGKCLICAIFGYPGLPHSPLHVTNFYPVKPDKIEEVASQGLTKALQQPDYWVLPETMYITRTRINDSTGTVSPGALYTYEHIYPGTLFYGEIYLYKNTLANYTKVVEDIEKIYSEAAVLILASISQLNYVTIGRNSVCSFRVLKVEPKELLEKRYVKALFENKPRSGD